MVSCVSEIYEQDLEEARIVAWYVVGIKHEVIRILKKQQDLRRNEMLILNKPLDDSEYESIEMIDTIAGSSNITKIEEKIDIDQILSHLTLKQQKVIKMIFFLELTEKEAAEKLGISQPAVHKIKNRALKKIKEHMKNYMN
ncbi:Bacteriocin UviA [Koleobacter methoxysyntrophicus]|uniref:Bacteriocin UviA n=1 Tax=Koleobacter methoxysyntrophicus TaxID=2751313 RepID=A0A8A0RIT9_9FIRM|nr:sigma-70 family RNA polymerase sigma factor [Koleobacter methoxysyntrophicus]QSQ07812.1 Bacteriocin UviA [Koleobacter methoxysyntrophicus]